MAATALAEAGIGPGGEEITNMKLETKRKARGVKNGRGRR